MWGSGRQMAGNNLELKLFNGQEFQTSRTEVEDAFMRLQVKQRHEELPKTRRNGDVGLELNSNTTSSTTVVERANVQPQPQPSASQTPEDSIIDDLDAHRLFLGRCNGAEQFYKVFVLLSSPGAEDTSWGPLRCSEAQAAVYEGAIKQSTSFAVFKKCVPDAYVNPSTNILRHIVAPAGEHIAALDSGAPMLWDRERIESTFSPAILQGALDASLTSEPPPWAAMMGPDQRLCSTGGLFDLRSSIDSRGRALSGCRRKTPIPHVHGIATWKGPPLSLDESTKQQLKQQVLEALCAPVDSSLHGSSAATPAACPATASAASCLVDGPSVMSRTVSLPSAGSLGRGGPVQPGHAGLRAATPPPAQRPRPPRRTSVGDSTPRGDMRPQAPVFQRHFGPWNDCAPFQPASMHDQNALCGGLPWEPPPRHSGSVDTHAIGPLGRQFLGANRMPPAPELHGAPLQMHGGSTALPEMHGHSIGSLGPDAGHVAEGGMAQMMMPGGPPGQLPHPRGHMYGDIAPEELPMAPAVPPQEMAKLMFRVAKQLGYPVQHMHEVVSCMQQDCLQAVTGAATW